MTTAEQLAHLRFQVRYWKAEADMRGAEADDLAATLDALQEEAEAFTRKWLAVFRDHGKPKPVLVAEEVEYGA